MHSEHNGIALRRTRPAGHRADIQGLRAIAVLLVALAHAGVPGLRGGYIGVDVFFVLSGFLITGLLLAEARRRHFVSLADFYLRRARRILPAALLTLLVTDVVADQLLNIVRARQYLEDSISSTLFAANIHFAAIGTDYFSQGQPPSPFQHYWSLAVEEQFYVVWPALFILLLGLSFRRYASRPEVLRERSFRRVAVVVGVVGLASLAWSIHSTDTNPTAAYFSTPARVWELALGAGLALTLPSLRSVPRRWRVVMGWSGLALVGIAALTFSASTPFPGYAALLPTLGAALIIAAGVQAPDSSRFSVSRALSLPPLGYVGDRSYSFYLWHWPVLVITAQYLGHSLSLGQNLLLLVAAFALSIVSYGLYEKPLRNANFTRAPRVAYAWIGGVVIVLALTMNWISSINDREDQLSWAAAASPPPVLAVAAPAAAAVPSQPKSSQAAADPRALPAVVHEVKLERSHHSRMPSVLIPPVSGLLGDLPVGVPGRCIAATGATSSPICRLGAASSSRTIVVIGDSHVQEWLPDIVSFARQDHWAVVPLIKEGCSPDRWLKGPVAYCPEWFRWAEREAGSLSPQVTVIGSRYSNFGPTLDADFAPGLNSAVAALRKHSRRLVIIGDVPLRSRQSVDCLLAAHATPAGCSEPLRAGEVEQTALVAQLAAFNHIGFIDPTGWFCYQQQCPLVIGNVITYRDDNHVSATYATELQMVFRAAFYAAIGQHAKA